MKKYVIYAILLGLIVLSLTFSGSAQLSVGFIQVEPEEPIPESTVTFTVEVMDPSGGAIESVNIIVEECNRDKGICYRPGYNISMTEGEPSQYQGEVTLTHEDATYITYWAEILHEGTWNTHDKTELNLSLDQGNGGNGNGTPGNGDNGNQSPGYEILLFLVALGVSFVILRKKRLR